MKTKLITILFVAILLLTACGPNVNAPLGAATIESGPSCPVDAPCEIPVTETPTVPPTATSTSIPPTATSTAIPPTATSTTAVNTGSSTVTTVFTATSALTYPSLIAPDPARQTVFPDVPFGSRPALARYEAPFEDGDYFETGHGDVDLPQFYFRVMTAGTIKIDQLGVDCVATETKGCALIIVNHFGPTAMFRDATVDNGFTVAGLVFDMSTPDKVSLAGQALADHYIYRMTMVPNDGANCSVITGCQSVEWHVIVIGNETVQIHWSGLYTRP